jgi:hypothetical protein
MANISADLKATLSMQLINALSLFQTTGVVGVVTWGLQGGDRSPARGTRFRGGSPRLFGDLSYERRRKRSLWIVASAMVVLPGVLAKSGCDTCCRRYRARLMR